MTKEKPTFGEWIDIQLEKRGWKPADLARESGLDTGVISNLRNDKRQTPAVTSCRALAEAFQIPVVEVYLAAGILDKEEIEETIVNTDNYDPITSATLVAMKHLTTKEKQELLDYARFKIQGRGKQRDDTDPQHARNRKGTAQHPA